MNKTELKKVKKNLVQLKDDLLIEFRANQENGNGYMNHVGDSIDQAVDSSERELLFELNDIDRERLDSIKNALNKIEKNTYGSCERCKNNIEKKRIKVKPDAIYCIKCKSEME